MRASKMSSEISTEASRRLRVRDSDDAANANAFQPWQLFTLAGLVGATIVVLFAKGQSPATVILLSLTVFAAALVGVAALRTVGPLTGLIGPSAPQILAGRTRAALEREKSLVLRSIKELEFDRAMGKVSEKDFVEMSGRLRARAAGLIRQLDAGTGYRDDIEREIERRLGGHSKGAVVTRVGETPVAALCKGCSTRNEPDAKFSKNCGNALGGSA
jgi:hypothetical protein